jgi:hypothetical protein
LAANARGGEGAAEEPREGVIADSRLGHDGMICDIATASALPPRLPGGWGGGREHVARRPTKVAAIALANKIARMAWAVMARGECYREPVTLAA